MTVKTDFSREDVIEILSNYKLGDFVDFNYISEGTVQTNLLIKTTGGNYVLRYYENRPLESVLFEINLIRYLRRRNYPCPAPFKNRDGDFTGMYNNKPYAIFEFIDGEHIENPDEGQRRQLIRRVAELHNITKNYRPLYRKFRWNYSAELCKRLAQEKAERTGTTDSKRKLNWLENELSSLKLPGSLPKGICHCDLHFSNILFKNGELVALIDFDDANYTFLIYDLAALIDPLIFTYSWDNWDKYKMIDDVFDFGEARKVISEYMRYRPLNNTEKKYLFDVLKLSILIDCLWYFERGDSDDFYEKRKIDHLNMKGRDRFYLELFG